MIAIALACAIVGFTGGLIMLVTANGTSGVMVGMFAMMVSLVTAILVGVGLQQKRTDTYQTKCRATEGAQYVNGTCYAIINGKITEVNP